MKLGTHQSPMDGPGGIYDFSGMTPFEVVQLLTSDHQRPAAIRHLLSLGKTGTTAVRLGLKHPDPAVRIACCRVLDHFTDEAALPELKANIDHSNTGVRSWAIHALACDRCKEGACRPGEEDVIPLVIHALLHDENRSVRQQTAGLLGLSVLRSEEAATAIMTAYCKDPHPSVRKVAE
tara:strand:+ start:5929 stop:6462 length:534 start_codon:yes stop_codon:yes gene_type:complete